MLSRQEKDLARRMLRGDRLALSRLMSMVEDRPPSLASLMQEIHPRTGRAYRIGVTGPPGAGKSTLIDRLIGIIRRKKKTVGVIAVDPSSPFTGGAVLGDRVRMQSHSLDDGVFIRSFGSRGSHGGVSQSTRDAVSLVDAFGMDIVVIETVGVGQTELDIVRQSDTTIVVLVPESGDTVQTMKAGLTEIGDIFVVNKGDREGAEDLAAEIRSMTRLSDREGWTPPVLVTRAAENRGIEGLYDAVLRHREFLAHRGWDRVRRRNWKKMEFLDLMVEEVRRAIVALDKGGRLARFVSALEKGRVSPHAAAIRALKSGKILEEVRKEL